MKIFFFIALVALTTGAWAYTEYFGRVESETASIYSVEQGTRKPIRFLKKGERVQINGQKVLKYYPLLGEENQFIAAKDITILKVVQRKRVTVNYLQFPATLTQNVDNGEFGKKDNLQFSGVGLKYGVFQSPKWYFQYSLKYFSSKAVKEESYDFLETGFGGLYTFYRSKRLRFHVELEANFIPHSYYRYRDDFEVHSFGASGLAGLNFLFQMSPAWAVETFAQYSHAKFFKFALPSPYEDVSPSFSGPRFGLGLAFSFL